MQLDQIWVGGQKLWVNTPRYDDVKKEEGERRNYQAVAPKIQDRSYAEVVLGLQERGPKKGSDFLLNQEVERRPTSSRIKTKTEHGSFGNRRVWKEKGIGKRWEGMEYNAKPEDYEWLKGCYVGTVHSVEMVRNLQEKFYMEGYFSCQIRAMGGKMVLLDCEEKEELKDLVEMASDWLSQWFEDVNGSCLQEEDDDVVGWQRRGMEKPREHATSGKGKQCNTREDSLEHIQNLKEVEIRVGAEEARLLQGDVALSEAWALRRENIWALVEKNSLDIAEGDPFWKGFEAEQRGIEEWIKKQREEGSTKKKRRIKMCRSVYAKSRAVGMGSKSKKGRRKQCKQDAEGRTEPSFLPCSKGKIAGDSVGVVAEDDREIIRRIEEMESRDSRDKAEKATHGSGDVRKCLISSRNGNWCLARDFNAVGSIEERAGCKGMSVEMEEFDDFIHNAGLIDLPLVGRKYTWYNSNGQYMSRIDRFLISEEHPECKEIIRTTWNSSEINGGKGYKLKEKLKMTKKALKDWSSKSMADVDRKISESEKMIAEIDEQGEKNTLSATNIEKRRNCFLDLWKHLRIKERMWQQKSRMAWLKEGDAKTKFFHRCVKGRSRRNEINYIQIKGVQHTGLVDGVVIANEVIDEAKRKKKKSFLFKVDFEKAYDNKFFMGGGGEERKIKWVNWDKVCKKKEEGGLGVRELRKFNLALLGKWWGRFAEKMEGLWKRVIIGKYGERGGHWLDWIKEKEGLGSTWWRDVCCIDKIDRERVGWLLEGFRIKLEDGKRVSFWWDNWCGVGYLANKYPRLYLLSTGKDNKCYQMGNDGNEQWSWNLQWRRKLFEWETEEAKELQQLIEDKRITQGRPDSWEWVHDKDGQYSTKTAYSILTKDQIETNEISTFKRIWNPKFPRILGESEDGKCVFCKVEDEDSKHLFLKCKITSWVWQECAKWWGIEIRLERDCWNSFQMFGKWSKDPKVPPKRRIRELEIKNGEREWRRRKVKRK
ncbi:hypothetical protein SLEP1_g45894 [Rubroshorea leprosula]|uniref:Reverse transcriptase zinc-binding domain-containing protein n=1 Tax=Rubroshorea leprosula TaxID=152421 RepID=A0AAV5LN20_9ROSI|nr:hypothetical protein SLEP1_g45894 [Rubroshorea leprosula]